MSVTFSALLRGAAAWARRAGFWFWAACAMAALAAAAAWWRRRSAEGFDAPPETIFVSVASYRDSACLATVQELFGKARHPERIYVGVCEQNSPSAEEVCLRPDFEHHARVRRVSLPHGEALGPTYARYLCSTLYRGETYFCQIDSHSRFAQDWDVNAVADLRKCGNARAVISHYPPSWEEMGKPASEIGVPRLCGADFDGNGLPVLEAVTLPPTAEPHPVPFVSGGFVFGPGAMVREVPYDPDLPMLFQGEEVLHAARLWTHGFDMYTPTDNYVYHFYMRESEPKFWDDVALAGQEQTHAKVRELLGGGLPDYPHGMGAARSLQEYMDFAGMDMAAKKSWCKDLHCN